MRLTCPFCHAKALIQSRNNMTDDHRVVELYCRCTRQECAATFVYSLAYRHVLNPPVHSIQDLARNLIENLTPKRTV